MQFANILSQTANRDLTILIQEATYQSICLIEFRIRFHNSPKRWSSSKNRYNFNRLQFACTIDLVPVSSFYGPANWWQKRFRHGLVLATDLLLQIADGEMFLILTMTKMIACEFVDCNRSSCHFSNTVILGNLDRIHISWWRGLIRSKMSSIWGVSKKGNEEPCVMASF